MSDSKRFYELLALKEAGKLSLHDRIELNKIIECDEELAALYGYLNEIFDADFSQSPQVNDELIEKRWSSLQQKISPVYTKRNIRFSKHILYWVAAASVLVAVAFTFFISDAPAHSKENIVSTRKGSKTNLVLPDGTQVWLNVDSKLSYNEDFGKSAREISLVGEAYFEVAKDKQRPFIVHTPSMDIKVVGTVFNVKAYPTDESSETSLFEGQVEVALKNSEKKIVLKPNEKLFVSNKYLNKKETTSAAGKEEAEITISHINLLPDKVTAVETQWTKNNLAFHNKKLGDVAAVLSRWYGVEITIADEKLKEKTYSGNFENENVEEVLDALKLTGGFQYTIENKQITIYP